MQDLPRILKYFEDAFDWLDAEKSGRITPHEGVDAEFDLRSENVATIKAKLEAYLKEQKEYFKNQCVRQPLLSADSTCMYLICKPRMA